jgi:ribulose kinase
MWLTEGGQSATGALLDHTIQSHARSRELSDEAKARGTTTYDLLNARLDDLGRRENVGFVGELTRELHVLPDHHGNRSPRADPTLRGMVSGLKLSDTIDSLALLYLATVQAIAHGTRHIIDAMNDKGYSIRTVVACGGDTKNPVFVREHAEATGCPIVIPKEPEAVLLGAAMLGAVASGRYPSLLSAMAAMNEAAALRSRRGAPSRDFTMRNIASSSGCTRISSPTVRSCAPAAQSIDEPMLKCVRFDAALSR